jgi:CheY-like chemotaxis protein
LRVLIVDDDMHRRQTIGEALHERFREVDTWMAQSAQEALIILGYMQRETFDLVFLDHDLLGSDWPDSADGRTVAREIKRLKVKAKQIIIQSVNLWGADGMKAILKGRKVTMAPFPLVLDLISTLDVDGTPTSVTT